MATPTPKKPSPQLPSYSLTMHRHRCQCSGPRIRASFRASEAGPGHMLSARGPETPRSGPRNGSLCVPDRCPGPGMCSGARFRALPGSLQCALIWALPKFLAGASQISRNHFYPNTHRFPGNFREIQEICARHCTDRIVVMLECLLKKLNLHALQCSLPSTIVSEWLTA